MVEKSVRAQQEKKSTDYMYMSIVDDREETIFDRFDIARLEIL